MHASKRFGHYWFISYSSKDKKAARQPVGECQKKERGRPFLAVLTIAGDIAAVVGLGAF